MDDDKEDFTLPPEAGATVDIFYQYLNELCHELTRRLVVLGVPGDWAINSTPNFLMTYLIAQCQNVRLHYHLPPITLEELHVLCDHTFSRQSLPSVKDKEKDHRLS